MNAYSWLWVAWIGLFLGIEIPAALHGDHPGHPQTLSMSVWWLIRGQGRLHYTARLGLVLFLAWLVVHLLSGGWI